MEIQIKNPGRVDYVINTSTEKKCKPWLYYRGYAKIVVSQKSSNKYVLEFVPTEEMTITEGFFDEFTKEPSRVSFFAYLLGKFSSFSSTFFSFSDRNVVSVQGNGNIISSNSFKISTEKHSKKVDFTLYLRMQRGKITSDKGVISV